MEDLGHRIKTTRENRKLTKKEAGEMLGVSGQLLGQYETGRQKPKMQFFIKWKEVFGEDLIKYETNVSRETNEAPQSLFNLTESNRILAESNKLLAQNTVELTALVKRSVDAPEESELTVGTILPGLQELLVDLGMGKYWKSRDEGHAALGKRLFGHLEKKKAKGIRDDSGKAHKGS